MVGKSSTRRVRLKARKNVVTFLICLPSRYAEDFRLLCQRNPVPCPLLAESKSVGKYSDLKSRMPKIQDGDIAAEIDLRTDASRYMVYSDGKLVKFQCQDILDDWTEDHVGFLIRCSISFKSALTLAGLPPLHTVMQRNYPIYRTNIPLSPAAVFTWGTFVVSMRPYALDRIDDVRTITRPRNGRRGCSGGVLRSWRKTSLALPRGWKPPAYVAISELSDIWAKGMASEPNNPTTPASGFQSLFGNVYKRDFGIGIIIYDNFNLFWGKVSRGYSDMLLSTHSTHVGLDRPRRASVACNYCRIRKKRCFGGNDGLACRACAIASRTCTYPNVQKTVRVPEAYLIQLEARLKAYERKRQNDTRRQGSLNVAPIEHQPQQDPPTAALSDGSESPTPIQDGEDIDDNPLTEKIAHLVLSPEGDKRYFGNSSSASLGKKFLDFVRSFKAGLDIGEDFITPTYNSNSNFSIRTNAHQSRPSATLLPPFPVAKRLYAAQYAYIGTIFSFISPETFEKNIREMYDREPDFSDIGDRLRYCQIFIILAFGQMYSINQWMSYDGPPGFKYFQQAMNLLPDIHEQPSVTFVEVLSLVGYFFQNLNRRDAAFLYIELALRMAISLGLHQEVSDNSLDDHAREHRRRLWWSVYSLDRILCVKSGNPLTIADEDIGVLPPSRLPDEPDICAATVLFHYTELSRILAKIMKNVYRTPRTTAYNLVSSVQSILAELTQWHSNLPQALQCDFTKLDSEISRQSVSIFLHYSQCINMTVRPLVFNVVRKCLQNHEKTGEWADWRNGLQQSTVLAVETCIAAARNSAAVMAAAAKQNLMATYGYMDGEHAFSAAIILVMINIAFPHNARDHAAMTLALDVLNSMAEKGNLHIRSLHRLLLNLYNTVLPVSADPDEEPAPTTPARQFLSPPAESAQPATLTTESGLEPGPELGYEAAPIPLPHFTPEDPLAAFLAAQQAAASTIPMPGEGGFIVPEELLSFENPASDAILWEEGYGTFDVGMDFDWAQWNA
ncbi:hypothetical protein BDBG_16104 [Blastomyces gilchristii SLH14081]|uniref:Zn(2)-C6 fungal-type domain-containing protein n=1 Tax=Blastomyces gilchristii (strain SLH14081) TaxID=559298 RepID=A0A179U7D4_BLAGS|nr:uncharacterized protein BDBG_16104 [Blastomyces gilchristii SLH14081]OAT03730.1 hypothetical protein BDBG_16104 [Blastomyces gilchristii SLH14081]